MIYIAIRGQSNNAEIWFKDSNNNPISPSTSASYIVRDFNGNMVVSGTAVQDISDTSHWTTTFSVPLAAPVSNGGEKYRIDWSLIDKDNTTHYATEYFLLVAEGEPPPRDVSVAMLEGKIFKDSIGLPFIPTSLTIEIHDIKGMRIYPPYATNVSTSVDDTLMTAVTVDTTKYTLVGNTYYFNFSANAIIPELIAGSYGANPFIIIWNYDLPTQAGNIEIHPLYVLNAKTLKFINDLDRDLNKAHVQEIDSTLSFTTAEMAHYVFSGIQHINVNDPQLTNFNVNNIPDEFSYIVSKAALLEAYHSWYLAEGLKAFEFTGQSTTLTIDRTQYIQTLMDQLNSYLETTIKNAKKIYFRSGAGSRFGTGTLSISMWAGTSLPYPIPSCLVGNTKVLTTLGWKTMEELVSPFQKGKYPISYIINGKAYFGSASFYKGKNHVFKVRLGNGAEITGTGGHRLLTYFLGFRCFRVWKKIINLKIGDKIVLDNNGIAEVIGITYEGFQDVYDILVPDQHRFVANGIIAHNSFLSNYRWR